MPDKFKVFPDQATADDINTRLPQGVNIQLTDDGQGNLIAPKLGIDSILSHVPVEPADIVVLGNLPIVDIPTDEETVLIAGAPIGSWSFVLEGTSGGSETFLTQATKMAIPSNLTPAILPANLHLVSMTWVNERDNCNDDIKIYLDDTLIYTWQLVDCRWGVINSQDTFAPLLALPERGLIKASITNTGAPSSKDGILTMYFRLVGDATAGEFIYPTL